jgi:Fe-S-cluster containining protein
MSIPIERLLAVYRAADAQVAEAAPVCEVSGRCCRFKEYGHTLFLSRTEADLLLSQGLPADSVVNDEGCPFQIRGLCTARDRRPLGCRVYFCDPAYAGRGEQISETAIAALKTLHQETETPWEYRPLIHFLREVVASPSTLPVASGGKAEQTCENHAESRTVSPRLPPGAE